MKSKLNHSRYLDYGAKGVGIAAQGAAESTPTHKQRQYVKRLCIMCKEQGLNPHVGQAIQTRGEYSDAIDTLVTQLKEAGVEMPESKDFARVLFVGTGLDGKEYAYEKIVRLDADGNPMRKQYTAEEKKKYYMAKMGRY